MMKKLTPVIVVDHIERCLPFWVDHLGFKKTTEVPDGDKLGVVILAKGNVEIMYQTKASVAKDYSSLRLAQMEFEVKRRCCRRSERRSY